MNRSDDDTPRLTEADRTSETRFGPRPVPEGHRTYPHRPLPSRRVTPSGRVGPDGQPWPEASLTARLVIWGGVAVGVAGITAAAVISARKLGDMMAGDDDPPRYAPVQFRTEVAAHDRHEARTLAPRFAELDEDDREEMRRRVRARARDDSRVAARRRAEAARRRHGPRNLAVDLTDTAADLSAGLNDLAASLTSAFNGFRSVAAQAGQIVAEFSATAEQLRGLMGRGEAPKRDDDRRTHRL